MYELNYLIFLLIIILSTFQTIVGVGILVLGTPILILYGFDIVEAMLFLLPLSIFNSTLNFIYLHKFKKGISIDINMGKYFFFICLPSVFVGLFFLKKFISYINFNLLICFVIWFVLILSYLNKERNFSENLKKIIIFVTGLLHGVTNSGGSLLSLLIVKSYDKSVNYKRFQIIFFYLFLATFQFFSIIFIFKKEFLDILDYYYIPAVFIGIITGNHLANSINDNQLKNFVKLLAFVASIFLLTKS
jgi:uncharacterized protein